MEVKKNAEMKRLEETSHAKVPWQKWGPYLSERQWGTVREDYSPHGDAWNYFTHDQARSRAYRWGEDGLAGFCDDKQLLCFALALWNGNDPVIKERLFGLSNSEGNHGEDVKEYYFYIDSTPTHSYMKYLYKYAQAAYPYADLVETNRRRTRDELEYELIDTGIFEEDRYFDVFVEYAKEDPEDILIKISVFNRGPQAAVLHVLPTLWFRNTWSWQPDSPKPSLRQIPGPAGSQTISASHAELGARWLYIEGEPGLLFTENETNNERIFGTSNASPYVKDGINEFVVHAREEAVNPQHSGTKAASHHRLSIEPGKSATMRLRLSPAGPQSIRPPFEKFDETFDQRQREADEFYAEVIPSTLNADETNVMRQALAGMLWSKQFYLYDVDRWLSERGADPFRIRPTTAPRNYQWHHMYNGDVISMPDKWEYPWYAAWDLAFHVLALSLVDIEFAKHQLGLVLRERYLHPNGQIPAYEWNFNDVNPPVHAWAVQFTYRLEKIQKGRGDIRWLKSCFQKLLLNFTWWVNRKDRFGHNVFEGGFLGLDNIGVFDRSAPLPTGGYLEQADGTAWMALYADNMLEIAMELAMGDDGYADMALKFLEHDALITSSLVRLGEGIGMWDEEDGFFYDVLRSGERAERLKVRSMVGLLPLCAATVFEPAFFKKYPEMSERFLRFVRGRPELRETCHDPTEPGVAGRRLFAVLDERRLRRVLEKMLDENEFLSPYGLRSVSRYHQDHPYVVHVGDQEYRVGYLPAESDTGMFGGNSNWRGPIWMPVNGLVIRALLNYHTYYGTDFTVECPTGSGRRMNLYEVAREISRRLNSIFLRGKDGRRPVYGGTTKFQNDRYWRDLIMFYEYFHGDNGAGIGASHQTGWTGIIARGMHLFETSTAEQFLELGMAASIVEVEPDKTAAS
ncbi:MAG: glucosidase [Deltaproteobacteria bacterium]|nr:glucosidase [Deltaproteobacteria bacterium]